MKSFFWNLEDSLMCLGSVVYCLCCSVDYQTCVVWITRLSMVVMHQQLDKKSEVLERFWTSEKKTDTRSVDLKFLKSSEKFWYQKIFRNSELFRGSEFNSEFSEVQIFGQTIFRCSDFLSSCWCTTGLFYWCCDIYLLHWIWTILSVWNQTHQTPPNTSRPFQTNKLFQIIC